MQCMLLQVRAGVVLHAATLSSLVYCIQELSLWAPTHRMQWKGISAGYWQHTWSLKAVVPLYDAIETCPSALVNAAPLQLSVPDSIVRRKQPQQNTSACWDTETCHEPASALFLQHKTIAFSQWSLFCLALLSEHVMCCLDAVWAPPYSSKGPIVCTCSEKRSLWAEWNTLDAKSCRR